MRSNHCRSAFQTVSWMAVLLCMGTALLAAAPTALKTTPEAIVAENGVCRYEIGRDGKNRALMNLSDKKDYLKSPTPLMRPGRGQQSWDSSRVEMTGDLLNVSFAGCDVRIRAKLEVHRKYFTLQVIKVSGGLDWLQFCNLQVKPTQNVGELVNAAWDDRFAVCVLACNDRTDCGSHGVPTARAYREFGIEGARVAIIGIPTGRPDPAARVLDAIETVELEQGLPHPTFNGVWIKRAPERFASYLMLSNVSRQNIDQVIELAKGGFGCIELTWWKSVPGYEPNPKLFPNGWADMRRVADKVHAAGLQMGLHVVQGMVGWTSKNDPYISPKADPRLLQDRHATLAGPLEPKATEIHTRESTAEWQPHGDLFLEGEIVRYAKRLPNGFAECRRGVHQTTVVPHPAGTRLGHLVDCFPIWGFNIYCPDIKSTMVDEICERIARAFNATGADMAYFDGGEEIAVQPPHWRNQGHTVLGVQSRLRRPVIVEGNALYTHLSWHVITRGSPSFDPIYFGRRPYTLRFKGQNPAGWAKNLLTGDVGWFYPHVHSPVTDAVTPDEVMLLCLKAVGGKAPISFQLDANHLWDNKRMPEMLQIIRDCDELKRRNYFTEAACAELAKPMAEYLLERTTTGHWDIRPLKFGPACTVDARRRERSEWSYVNPHGEQAPWLRIRARSALASYGEKGNRVLADPASGVPFQPDGTASADLVQSVEPSSEKTPDGGPAFCYRAENRARTPSDWTRVTLALPKPLNLSKHRRLGLWIRTEGQGGILNVQLGGIDARRDHYISLENRGWACVVLDPPEDDRFFDYAWPYSFTDLMYSCQKIYSHTARLHLYYNRLPAGAKVACWIGRIEALEERPWPLVSPALEVGERRQTFPVSLKPDEYLELDWAGGCRHFDPNGGQLGPVVPQGATRLAPGNNHVKFSCMVSGDASPRAEVTLSVRGQPLPNACRPGK